MMLYYVIDYFILVVNNGRRKHLDQPEAQSAKAPCRTRRFRVASSNAALSVLLEDVNGVLQKIFGIVGDD
jgi:hypothetical protein